jgi:hypothetical protein
VVEIPVRPEKDETPFFPSSDIFRAIEPLKLTNYCPGPICQYELIR